MDRREEILPFAVSLSPCDVRVLLLPSDLLEARRNVFRT
jgi:hypothetical protein